MSLSRTCPSGLLLALILLTACTARSDAARTTSRQIVREDLAGYSTLWDAIAARRSNWLQRRTPLYLDPRSETGTRDASPIWVYRDNRLIGDIGVLRNQSPAGIEMVEFFDARAATLRWGINHDNGVIHITSRSSI